MKKVVITGGSYGGKTTIVKEFAKENYPIVIETAIEIITELVERMGLEGQKEWREHNLNKFQTMIAERQVEYESNSAGKVVFCDRGLHDCIAFCKLEGKPVPSKVLELAENNKYDLVFIFETLKSFNLRANTGRILDEENSKKVHQILKEVYSSYGFKVIEVPEMTVKERMDFVKKFL